MILFSCRVQYKYDFEEVAANQFSIIVNDALQVATGGFADASSNALEFDAATMRELAEVATTNDSNSEQARAIINFITTVTCASEALGRALPPLTATCVLTLQPGSLMKRLRAGSALTGSDVFLTKQLLRTHGNSILEQRFVNAKQTKAFVVVVKFGQQHVAALYPLDDPGDDDEEQVEDLTGPEFDAWQLEDNVHLNDHLDLTADSDCPPWDSDRDDDDEESGDSEDSEDSEEDEDAGESKLKAASASVAADSNIDGDDDEDEESGDLDDSEDSEEDEDAGESKLKAASASVAAPLAASPMASSSAVHKQLSVAKAHNKMAAAPVVKTQLSAAKSPLVGSSPPAPAPKRLASEPAALSSSPPAPPPKRAAGAAPTRKPFKLTPASTAHAHGTRQTTKDKSASTAPGKSPKKDGAKDSGGD